MFECKTANTVDKAKKAEDVDGDVMLIEYSKMCNLD